jgi:hypothetical protein
MRIYQLSCLFRNGTQVLVSRYDPLREEPLIGSVLSRTQSQIRVCFPNHFDLDEGQWRLDLGRPNLMYERMRAAVSHLRNDVQKIEDEVPSGSTEFILQGTKVRDVILRSFKIENEFAVPTRGEPSNVIASTASSGIFKQDQRIQSWARRYSQPNPMIMEGDPPLDGLNASQVRAMATMISERMSLIQGVSLFFLKIEARCQEEMTILVLASRHRKNENHHRNYQTTQSQLVHTCLSSYDLSPIFTGTFRGAPPDSRLYIHKRRGGQSR